MERRGGSLSVSPLCFDSVVARCPLWQKRIMRREERRFQRDEDEERKGKKTESKEKRGWAASG